MSMKRCQHSGMAYVNQSNMLSGEIVTIWRLQVGLKLKMQPR